MLPPLHTCARFTPLKKEKVFDGRYDEKVKQIVVEQLGVDEAEVTPNASFVDDLGADSLDTVELVMAFEEAFDIRSPTNTPRRSAP